MAALLASGPGAVLSHRSAASLWGFAKEHPAYIDVSVRRTSEARIDGLRCHRRPSLPSEEVDLRLNIPLTSPVRTFLDLATVTGPKTIERSVNEADKLDVIDADSLRKALEDHPGEPGIRLLRHVLDKHTFRLSDDELERLFRPLATAAGLSTPLTKHMVNGFEVDFYWPDLDLVVETDGLRYHRTPTQQQSDRIRDQAHTQAGLTPLRFTHAQVAFEPRQVGAVLGSVANRLGARRMRL
jgi:very-short-patch-repair endonuclease